MMSSEPPGDRESEYQGRFHPTMDFELMNSYRLSGVLCDVTIMVKGIEFPAHKLVLAVNSPYFRATFASDFESHADHTLECDPSAFGAILNTLYSGIMMMITPDTAQDILEAASMLNISRVMENCCQVLELNMDADNCLDLLSLAKSHGCAELADKAEQFSGVHFDDIVKSTEFSNYPAEKLASLLSLDSLQVPEDSVFQAIMDWTGHDATSRSALLTKLLSHIRVPYISQDFLHAKAIPFLRANEDCQDYVKKLVCYLELNEEEKLTNSLHSINPRDFESEVIVSLVIEDDELELHVLDSEFSQWTRITSIPLMSMTGGICVMDGKLYSLNYSCDGSNDHLNEIDLLNKTTRLVTYLDTDRSEPCIAALNGKIYIIGGVDMNSNASLSTVEVCNPKDNSCNYVASMSSRRSGHEVIAYGGRIYVFGGGESTLPSSSAEVYIPEEDRWEELPSMPVERGYSLVEEVGGKIYVMKGSDTDTDTSVDCFDPERKLWTRVPDLSYKYDDMTSAVNWKGVLHVFHSQESEEESDEESGDESDTESEEENDEADSMQYHTHVEIYNPKANQWITKNSFVTSIDSQRIFVIKKKFLGHEVKG